METVILGNTGCVANKSHTREAIRNDGCDQYSLLQSVIPSYRVVETTMAREIDKRRLCRSSVATDSNAILARLDRSGAEAGDPTETGMELSPMVGLAHAGMRLDDSAKLKDICRS